MQRLNVSMDVGICRSRLDGVLYLPSQQFKSILGRTGHRTSEPIYSKSFCDGQCKQPKRRR